MVENRIMSEFPYLLLHLPCQFFTYDAGNDMAPATCGLVLDVAMFVLFDFSSLQTTVFYSHIWLTLSMLRDPTQKNHSTYDMQH